MKSDQHSAIAEETFSIPHIVDYSLVEQDLSVLSSSTKDTSNAYTYKLLYYLHRVSQLLEETVKNSQKHILPYLKNNGV